MKWIRKIDRETFLLVIAPLIVAFVASCVASAAIKGTPFLIFIGLAFLIACLYILSFAIVGKKLLDSMVTNLDIRLPSPQVVFENENMAREEIVKIVDNAKEFIAATGSKSRVPAYLEAIERKLLQPGFRSYRRVLLGEEVTKEMCQHLCKILQTPNMRNKTVICRHKRTDLGYFTVTDQGWFTFMPSPREGAPLENFIKISGNSTVINFFRTYINEYLFYRAEERNIASPERIRQLCEVRASKGKCTICGESKKVD